MGFARLIPSPAEPRSRTQRLTLTDNELRLAFKSLKTSRDVARLLDVPYWQLSYAIWRTPLAKRYQSRAIKKKKGGFRNLLVPNVALAILQRKLAQVLSAVYRPKACVHGFAKDRSILTNAKQHVRCEWVLNIDIADFFPSINFGRVRGVFRAKPYSLPDVIATTLAQICCHNNQLPQGAPTSPIVSNMVCARLDGHLLELAKQHRVTYTRFADDLTFSTRRKNFPSTLAIPDTKRPLAVVGQDLQAIINANGFSVNTAKCRIQGRTTRQEVTGITVSQFPNVPRTFVRRIRSMLHAWERFGYDAAEAEYRAKYNKKDRAPHRGPISFKKVVHGHIAYLAMVRGATDPIVSQLWRRYGQLDPDYARKPKRSLHDIVRVSLWVLECESDCEQGSAFAVSGLGLITCDHTLGSATHAFQASAIGAKFPVNVVARSKGLDLAVLSIPAEFPNALTLKANYRPTIGDHVNVAGFSNYQEGDTGYFMGQRIAGIRPASGVPRALVDGPIAAGMSGGPVVDAEGHVIGVIVSGAPKLSQANMTERHGFIPIEVLVGFLRDNNILPMEGLV